MILDEARVLFKRAEITTGLASPEWVRLFDQEARRPQIGARDPDTGTVQAIATIERHCPHDDEELLFHARDFLEAAFVVAREAFRVIRERDAEIAQLKARTEQRKPKDYAAQCAMLCERHDFGRYMMERHDLESASDRERVASRVRSVLNIAYRSELNTNAKAGERWLSLHRDFENWKRGSPL